MRGKNKNKIALLIGIACCIIGVILMGIGVLFGGVNYVKEADLNRLSGNAKRREYQVAKIEKKDLPDIKSLKIETSVSDICIKTSEDEKFHISYPIWQNEDGKSDDYDISCRAESGVLEFKETVKGAKSGDYGITIGVDFWDFIEDMNKLSKLGKKGFNRTDKDETQYTVFLYIPKGAKMDFVSLALTVGDLKIDILESEKMNLSSDCGNITLSNLVVQKAEWKQSYGDAEITDSVLQNTEFESEAGDLYVNNTIWNEGNISVKYGDVKINNSKLAKIDFVSESGAVTLQDVVWREGSIKAEYGDIKIKRFEPIGEVEIKNSSGDISIDMEESIIKRINYDFRADCGDINISNKIDGDLRSKDDGERFIKNESEEKNKLIVESEYGDILIK